MTTTEDLPGYLDRFLVSEVDPERDQVTRQERAQVSVPGCPRPISPARLERALNDPYVLFSRDVRGQPEEQLRVLFHFALWLGDSPPELVPRKLASRAARFRFGVWSLLPRLDWPAWRPEKVIWSVTDPPRRDDDVVLSRNLVLAEARAARDDWLAQLNAWEDDTWLAARQYGDPDLFESDLRWITTTWPTPAPGERPWPADPGYLSLESADIGKFETYRRVATDLAELHWLPRGSVRSAAAALLPTNRAGRLLPWLFPLAALVVLGLFAGTLVLAAAICALVLMVIGIVAAGLLPGRLAGMALLRIPAAAAVGLVVLLSLTSQWWLNPHGWILGAGLLFFAAFYLILESRSHGASRRRAYRRGLLVWAAGVAHAFVLSLVTLAFVAPVVADHGNCLDGWWRLSPWSARPLRPDCMDLHGPAAASFGVLVLMTGWSLAGGLAAQILWDDRPVTAPLGRLRRVRGAAP